MYVLDTFLCVRKQDTRKPSDVFAVPSVSGPALWSCWVVITPGLLWWHSQHKNVPTAEQRTHFNILRLERARVALPRHPAATWFSHPHKIPTETSWIRLCYICVVLSSLQSASQWCFINLSVLPIQSHLASVFSLFSHLSFLLPFLLPLPRSLQHPCLPFPQFPQLVFLCAFPPFLLPFSALALPVSLPRWSLIEFRQMSVKGKWE